MRHLPVLCPQEYSSSMRATTCSRCDTGWDAKLKRCTIDTGAEHLLDILDDPTMPVEDRVVPECPIQDRCQHQIQTPSKPCVVRRKGLICESALIEGGLSAEDAAEHPLGFNAEVVASPQDIAEYMAEHNVSAERIAAYLEIWE